MKLGQPGRCYSLPAPEPAGAVFPLVLSMPGDPLLCTGCAQPATADINLIRRASKGVLPAALSPPMDENERLHYRWLVGHHAAFAIWQMLTDFLAAMLRGPEPDGDAVVQAAGMLDAYSALFVYSGSCSAARYAATLRPMMRRCDPAFSGEWARDYKPFREALETTIRAHPKALVAPLVEARRASHRVHMTVAGALVPNGGSLLQAAGRRPGQIASPAEEDRFDTFFHVFRKPVCHRARAAQLLRRLAQINCDMFVHGLYPPGVPVPRLSGPHAHTVDRIISNVPAILRQCAELVYGLERRRMDPGWTTSKVS
jgi:hypothetical protein